MQSRPMISGSSRTFAIFQLPLKRRLVRYRLHICQLVRSNGSVAATVTLDDLDLLL